MRTPLLNLKKSPTVHSNYNKESILVRSEFQALTITGGVATFTLSEPMGVGNLIYLGNANLLNNYSYSPDNFTTFRQIARGGRRGQYQIKEFQEGEDPLNINIVCALDGAIRVGVYEFVNILYNNHDFRSELLSSGYTNGGSSMLLEDMSYTKGSLILFCDLANTGTLDYQEPDSFDSFRTSGELGMGYEYPDYSDELKTRLIKWTAAVQRDWRVHKFLKS